jgi:hypothetical protein
VVINQDLAKTSGKMLFVFWQCRAEKPTRPLTLNKDTVWCGLRLHKATMMVGVAQMKRKKHLLFCKTIDQEIEDFYILIQSCRYL